MDAAMEHYPRRDVAVLMYHEHIPEPDPLANPSSAQRLTFYDVRGTPTLAIDGETVTGGGQSRGGPGHLRALLAEDRYSAQSFPGNCPWP